MAAILVYAGVKGYHKYQAKKANSSSNNRKKSRKNHRSISNLVIPSVASANIIPGGEETMDDSQPPQYELYEEKASVQPPNRTAPYPPDSLCPPPRPAPPPPVILGLTLCESPSTPPSEFDGSSHIDCRSSRSKAQEDSPAIRLSRAFELASEEQFDEPMSPAPLHVVKRSSSPLPLLEEESDMTYSSDKSEGCEEGHRGSERSIYLDVPKSAKELLDFEPPPIPQKSPARRLRVALIE